MIARLTGTQIADADAGQAARIAVSDPRNFPELPDTDVRFVRPSNDDGARIRDPSRESRCQYPGSGYADTARTVRRVAMNLVGPRARCNALCTNTK